MLPEGLVKAQDCTMELLGALLQNASRTTKEQENWQEQIQGLAKEVKHLRGKLPMAEAIALNEQRAAKELLQRLRQEEERRLEAENLNSWQAAWHLNDHAQRYAWVLLQQLQIRHPHLASHLHMLTQSALGEARILQGICISR